MPPTEANGKQIEFVDQSAQQIDTVAYLNARKAQALLGNVFNPEVGFALGGQHRRRPEVSLYAVLRFLQPARCSGLEPEL